MNSNDHVEEFADTGNGWGRRARKEFSNAIRGAGIASKYLAIVCVFFITGIGLLMFYISSAYPTVVDEASGTAESLESLSKEVPYGVVPPILKRAKLTYPLKWILWRRTNRGTTQFSFQASGHFDLESIPHEILNEQIKIKEQIKNKTRHRYVRANDSTPCVMSCHCAPGQEVVEIWFSINGTQRISLVFLNKHTGEFLIDISVIVSARLLEDAVVLEP